MAFALVISVLSLGCLFAYFNLRKKFLALKLELRDLQSKLIEFKVIKSQEVIAEKKQQLPLTEIVVSDEQENFSKPTDDISLTQFRTTRSKPAPPKVSESPKPPKRSKPPIKLNNTSHLSFYDIFVFFAVILFVTLSVVSLRVFGVSYFNLSVLIYIELLILSLLIQMVRRFYLLMLVHTLIFFVEALFVLQVAFFVIDSSLLSHNSYWGTVFMSGLMGCWGFFTPSLSRINKIFISPLSSLALSPVVFVLSFMLIKTNNLIVWCYAVSFVLLTCCRQFLSQKLKSYFDASLICCLVLFLIKIYFLLFLNANMKWLDFWHEWSVGVFVLGSLMAFSFLVKPLNKRFVKVQVYLFSLLLFLGIGFAYSFSFSFSQELGVIQTFLYTFLSVCCLKLFFFSQKPREKNYEFFEAIGHPVFYSALFFLVFTVLQYFTLAFTPSVLAYSFVSFRLVVGLTLLLAVFLWIYATRASQPIENPPRFYDLLKKVTGDLFLLLVVLTVFVESKAALSPLLLAFCSLGLLFISQKNKNLA